MSRFRFQYPVWQEIAPVSWLDEWAKRYGEGDNCVYFELIERTGGLSSGDFEKVGKWKEGCLKPGHGSWKTGTPKAYDTWMQAANESPKSPEQCELSEFLEIWSSRTFVAGRKDGADLRYRFGLSRATTLLHFVSRAEYPIFDSRVASALNRLGSRFEETIEGYLTSFCPLFLEIAEACCVAGVRGLRQLDNALFMFGADTTFPRENWTDVNDENPHLPPTQ